MDALRETATRMAERLRVFQRLHTQAVERGDSEITLHVSEFWEPSDTAALDAYEAALNEITGAQPLPFGGE